MLRWLLAAMHLFAEASAARRDVRIRFLMVQIEILRRKLGGASTPAEAIGSPMAVNSPFR